ncbi:AraC family transcriptional regulator [Pontibacter sp. H249]|uniref:AraC family transcriptional regulator n=1 Tax=Pontibacter sp. H249 TaxID=3133420 RepID=UPI0030BB097D
MLYQEIDPHPELKPFILDYWSFKVPSFADLGQQEVKHVAPADGCVSLLLLYNQVQKYKMALVIGPSTEAVQTMVQPDSVYLGIRFVPGMFCALFDVKNRDLKNVKVPLQHLLPHLNLQPLLQELNLDFNNFKLVDNFLLQLLPMHNPVKYDVEVNKAVRLIMSGGGNISIRNVMAQACLSERQLQKRFKHSTYLSMKELAKICRLRLAIAKVHLEQKSISDAVHEAGYFDQSHYNHDLHQATKRKPEDFYKHISQIKHVDVKPLQQKED